MNPSRNLTDIIWLDRTDSTNNALRAMSEGMDNLSVLAAREQSSGRGLGDHSWCSDPGMNLTFSMLLRPAALEARDLVCITCGTTLGIRDYLLEKGVMARIKWPNDIWVEGRKICGILIENALHAQMIARSIIGVGFNLNQTVWPADLPNPVSLKQLTGEDYSPRAELEDLVQKIRRRLVLVDFPDGRKELQEEFGKYVFRLPSKP